MDNVFVIALIFAYFRIPTEHQHRVLFWGILGALIMRGLMILAGVSLIERFEWLLYLFGAFLIYSSLKMMFAEEEGVHPEKNPVIRLAQKVYPVANTFDGQKFIARVDGRRALTPLAIVLLMVETTDVIFAVDSIPAIFGLTTDPFIVFTSNVFAILGLRLFSLPQSRSRHRAGLHRRQDAARSTSQGTRTQGSALVPDRN